MYNIIENSKRGFDSHSKKKKLSCTSSSNEVPEQNVLKLGILCPPYYMRYITRNCLLDNILNKYNILLTVKSHNKSNRIRSRLEAATTTAAG